MNLPTEADTRKVNEAKQEAARHVLGYYGHPGGFTPGGFTSGLISLFEKADAQNRAKLGKAYPYIWHALKLLEMGGDEDLAKWGGLA